MKILRELANLWNNATAKILKAGEDVLKEKILQKVLPKKYAQNHENRLCHIHDLEFYDVTYNCIGYNVADLLGKEKMSFSKALRKLGREIIRITNMQSGGIGFLNFDSDMAEYMGEEDDEVIIEGFRELFYDLNMTTRKGCEKPYVTFNFGLDTTDNGRRCSKLLLEAYIQGDEQGNPFIFPNLVFKMKSGINKEPSTLNYDIFQQALATTAKRMVPTYFNCDSTSNIVAEAENIGIMGCRTRVVSNVYGENTGLKRGNVACVTINLVQLAYMASHDINKFMASLKVVMQDAKEVLLHRFHTLVENGDFHEIYEKNLYMGAEQKDTYEMLKNGTLAIGFIGLWDALAVLHNCSFHNIEDLKVFEKEAIYIIETMRCLTDQMTKEEKLNFSLLASAAEGVTGRFASYDSIHKGKGNPISEKGYYSNSFHVPVDMEVDYCEKIEMEGKFHALCNGGSITYVELKEMPNHNVDAVQEIVEYAYEKDCNYIGINFPLDHCKECGFIGRISSNCPKCQSNHITRLRRVSGYLAETDRFTNGKKYELLDRVNHR